MTTTLDAALTASQLRAIVQSTPPVDLPPLTALLVEALVTSADASPPLSIGQVAGLVGVSEHTLRWYERIGLVTVARSSGGQRSYDAEAIGRLIFITRLRLTDMPITEIQRYVALVAHGPQSEPERLALLEQHRRTLHARLDEIAFALAVVDYKILNYGGRCAPAIETSA